jgi:hypothetical protein
MQLYQWQEQKQEWDKEFWKLMLFNIKPTKKTFFSRPIDISLPLLGENTTIAPHALEITTFLPILYERRYTLKKVEETKESILFKKIYDSNYEGNLDAGFCLHLDDGFNEGNFHEAYFLKGEFKIGRIPAGTANSLGEFKNALTQYFQMTIPNLAEELEGLIFNSNLPQKQIEAVRDLWKQN